MPEVSIIINCLNEDRYLRAALDSAFAQTYEDWEIILFDNASTDTTKEIAASYGERVRYFSSEITIPLSQARNRAIEQAHGKYLAILDGDDIWLPDKLKRQMALYDTDPSLGMTYCDSMMFNQDGDQVSFFKVSKPHRGSILGPLMTRNFISSSAIMFRREALDSLDCAFDESYLRVADWDLTLRMAYYFPSDYVNEPLSRCRTYTLEDKPWKKDWIPRELEAMTSLDRLVEKYPDIQERYGHELKLCYRQLDYVAGMNAWERGQVSTARGYFARHLRHKKFAFVFLCSLALPKPWFDSLRSFYRKPRLLPAKSSDRHQDTHGQNPSSPG